MPQSRRSALRLGGTMLLSTLAGCSFGTNTSENASRRTQTSVEKTTNSRTRTLRTSAETPTSAETVTGSSTHTPHTSCFGPDEETPSDENGVWFAMEFDQTVTDENGRELSLKCDKITLHGATHDWTATYDVGSPPEKPEFVEGVYEPETKNDRTFRWFGRRVLIKFPPRSGEFDIIGDFHLTFLPATTPLPVTICGADSYSTVLRKSGWHKHAFSFHGESQFKGLPQ